jgi:hypothetical protein
MLSTIIIVVQRIVEPAPVIITRALAVAVGVGVLVFALIAGTAKLIAPRADVGSSATLGAWTAVGVTAVVLTWRWQKRS